MEQWNRLSVADSDHQWVYKLTGSHGYTFTAIDIHGCVTGLTFFLQKEKHFL